MAIGKSVSASAPGRCGIVGNPSDIYGGFVVSCSVPLRNTCTITLTEEEELPEDITLWRAATARFPIPACQVEWNCEVPRSSGLAGSTALLAATLACVLSVRGEGIEPNAEFAELVRDIELNDAGIVCGYQDAYMAVHGGLQAMDFAGKHPIEGGPPGVLKTLDAELPFLLITTGVERLSGSVHGPMRERWLNGDPEVVQGMKKIAELGRIGANALTSHDWPILGKAMDENHKIVASLGGSGDQIDDLIGKCKRGGAISAKLAGAGMGGTVIALTEEPQQLEYTLREAGYSRFLKPQVVEGLRFES